MAVIAQPHIPSVGWLSKTGSKLYDVYSFFIGLSNDLSNVLIVGKHLSTPFRRLSYLFRDISFKLTNADRQLSEARAWIMHLISGNGFIALLRWSSRELYAIRQNPRHWLVRQLASINHELVVLLFNPRQWLVRRLRDLSSDLVNFIYNPKGLIRRILRSYAYWIDHFLSNPVSFIARQLSVLMPSINHFLRNPSLYITNVIRRVIGDFTTLANNPREWLLRHLSQFNPQIRALLTNPEYYLRNYIAGLFNMPMSFWSDPYHYLVTMIIKQIRLKLNRYQSELKELIVSIILYFI